MIEDDEDLTHVLGVDPGGAKTGETGIVLVRYSDKRPAEMLDSWAVGGGVEGFLAWYNGGSVDPKAMDYVIIEHFVNRNIRGADLTPCFVEGAVHALFYNHARIVLQPASGKDTAVPDKNMRAAGYYVPGGHHKDVNSAMKHVLFWLKKQRHAATLRKVFPND